MFSRISACIEFEDLSPSEKIKLVERYYDAIIACLDDNDKTTIEESDIFGWFTMNAARYDNIRTMKTKMERAIFGVLSAKLINEA